MRKYRIFFVAIAVGLTGWVCLRLTLVRESPPVSNGRSTQAQAEQSWRTGQLRHWRQMAFVKGKYGY
ncbi:unnamed protein product [Gemmataceae bacterium]|nr:unnamed protein product [Gemmataceae bacterium]VTT99573.1 unnamed protein product [Gemmataceae bacterium]